MPQPNVLILRAPGTNCDLETAFAFEAAGAATERVHINRVLEEPELLDRFQILCLPGGFSYGDDVAAGQILANQIEHHLGEQMTRFKDAGKPILGICNGFQILIKSGLLLEQKIAVASLTNDKSPEAHLDPKSSVATPLATLTWNDSGQYEDRWARVGTHGTKCIFLKDIDEMYLPVAHAEGKFVARDEDAFEQLDTAGQLVLRYLPLDGMGQTRTAEPQRVGRLGVLKKTVGPSASDCGQLPFPDNPNGSTGNVAGVCDATGRVLGLMPHPERHITRTQHPRWTRLETTRTGDGLKMFENAVAYFA